MHYVRLLRSPTLTVGKGRQPTLDLVFTINTDLGDSYLDPEAPLPITISVSVPSKNGIESLAPVSPNNLHKWESGKRVLKLSIPFPYKRLPAQDKKPWRICIKPGLPFNAGSVAGIVSSLREPGCGLVMPVWADVESPGHEAAHLCLRRLHLGDDAATHILEVEEEIGESMARHLWDASLVAVPILHNMLIPQGTGDATSMEVLSQILSPDRAISIIELGCGVGILGIGIGHILSMTKSSPSARSLILLTDLPDAEKRTRGNIDRFTALQAKAATVRLQYENLDWEDGRVGTFGPEASARAWDLVILSDCTYNIDTIPALVQTLSHIHGANITHHKPTSSIPPTRVLLVTKPRHSSENVVFKLISDEGWSMQEQLISPLPVLGHTVSGPQSVQLYLFQKS